MDLSIIIEASFVALCVLAVATVISNGVLLFTFYKDPLKCLRTPSAIFIAGLTSANFLTGLIVEPASVAFYIWDDVNKFLRFIFACAFITTNASFLIMLALAVIQYLLIKCPHVYQKVDSPKSALAHGTFILTVILIITVWPFCITLAIVIFNFTWRAYITLMIAELFLLWKFALDPFVFAWRLREFRKSLVLAMQTTCCCPKPSLLGATYVRQDDAAPSPEPEDNDEDVEVTVVDNKDQDQAATA